jgi:hypothetical protein
MVESSEEGGISYAKPFDINAGIRAPTEEMEEQKKEAKGEGEGVTEEKEG